MFRVTYGNIYMTQGDTVRFSIGLHKDSDYKLTSGDQVYFIVTKTPQIVDIDDIVSGDADYIFYKTGTNILIEPGDTESLKRDTYYYHVRVILSQNHDVNTIIEPHEFNITPIDNNCRY